MANNYTIKYGDTLSQIAKAVGTTAAALASANGIINPNAILAGDTLVIPDSSGTDTGYKYNPFEHPEYKESDEVIALGTQKTDAENAVANYGDFAFSKQGDYDSIYDAYMNRDKFSYDFNADAIYQQYKDKYIQQGKMAMADTMGQAAAMTGGYGNSYAASVGNQAYQKSLENLNDIIPDLYQMAYDRYRQEGQDVQNMLAMLGDERNFEYGKWGDGYNRLVGERDYISGQYDSEWNRDYGMYESDRDLAHGEHTNKEGYNYQNYRDAIADEQWQKNYDLSARELAMAEEAWELEKSEMAKTTGSKQPVNQPTKNENKDEYDEKDTYADWNAGDWESYFAQIRQSEGKSAAEKELDYFVEKGLIPKNMIALAAIGARGKLGH